MSSADAVVMTATDYLLRGQVRLAQVQARLEGNLNLQAVAALRLGEVALAWAVIEQLSQTARRTVLQARAHFLLGQLSVLQAEQARHQARQEGDAPALIAAVTLLAELQLLSAHPDSDRSHPDHFVPLRTLAEGLKVAELLGQSADAHLLAVLAVAQAPNARKAAQTASKALARASVGSPAQVGALLLLGETAQARQNQSQAELDGRWLRVFEVASV